MLTVACTSTSETCSSMYVPVPRGYGKLLGHVLLLNGTWMTCICLCTSIHGTCYTDVCIDECTSTKRTCSVL